MLQLICFACSWIPGCYGEGKSKLIYWIIRLYLQMFLLHFLITSCMFSLISRTATKILLSSWTKQFPSTRTITTESLKGYQILLFQAKSLFLSENLNSAASRMTCARKVSLNCSLLRKTVMLYKK